MSGGSMDAECSTKSPRERERAEAKGIAIGDTDARGRNGSSRCPGVLSDDVPTDVHGVTVPVSRSGFVLEPKQLEAKLSILALQQQGVFGASDASDKGGGSMEGRASEEDGLPGNASDLDSGAAVDPRTRSDSRASALSTTVCLCGVLVCVISCI